MLETYRILLMIAGVLTIVMGLISGLVYMIDGGNLFTFLFVEIISVIGSIPLFAMAELISLGLSVESDLSTLVRSNNQQNAALMQRLAALEPSNTALQNPDTILPAQEVPADVPPDAPETSTRPAVTLSGEVTAARAMLYQERRRGAAIYKVVMRGQMLALTGRSEDGTWLRVLLDEDRDVWVEASDVGVKGNIEALPIIP
jgi:hypothetical protein